MRACEASLTYKLVSRGEDLRLDRPAKVAACMADAFLRSPQQEAF